MKATREQVLQMAREAKLNETSAKLLAEELETLVHLAQQFTLDQTREQKPAAYMQIGLGDNAGESIARTYLPQKYNHEWWRFDPLYRVPEKLE